MVGFDMVADGNFACADIAQYIPPTGMFLVCWICHTCNEARAGLVLVNARIPAE